MEPNAINKMNKLIDNWAIIALFYLANTYRGQGCPYNEPKGQLILKR